jgi:hypothetical protein
MNKEHAIQLTSFIERFQEEKPLYTIQTEPLTMMPYNYGEAIDDFQSYFLKNHLTRLDCYVIENEFIKNYEYPIWFNQLTETQVMQCISYIIRKDRFVDGFIAMNIRNSIIPTLLNRLKVLYNL